MAKQAAAPETPVQPPIPRPRRQSQAKKKPSPPKATELLNDEAAFPTLPAQILTKATEPFNDEELSKVELLDDEELSDEEVRKIELKECHEICRDFIVIAASRGLLRRGENIGLIPGISKDYADMSERYLSTVSEERILTASSFHLYGEYVRIMIEQGTHPTEIFPAAFALMEAITSLVKTP